MTSRTSAGTKRSASAAVRPTAHGDHPAGVRIGQHESRLRSAIQIAEKRTFKNYRDDVALDTRSMKTALSYIRQVVREGPKDSLDVDGTIDATCRNAGELEFIWERAKKKRIKLMLLMDAGGTMTQHAELVSRLFQRPRILLRISSSIISTTASTRNSTRTSTR